MMQLEFVTVDVFTERRFGGNPLAVVSDARELTTEHMQSIAAEFNLAETTFVLPPQDPVHTAEVRIFTPRAEVPFAGHPNVGTAFVLARQGKCHGRRVNDPLVFEEKAGLVRLDLIRDGTFVVGARLTPPQLLRRGDNITPGVVAAACSLALSDIETANHAPCIASCGLPFVFAELKTRAALAKARPRTEVFAESLQADRATGLFLYVADQNGGFDVQSRMFAPLYGVPEDPATGSANVALAGLLASLRRERAYAVARAFRPLLVNSVVGFIGPEYLFDGKQITRAGLEDHFCAKLMGVPMGVDVCYTNHAEADQDDMDALLALLVAAGVNFVMGVPGADDIMLGYQSTSFHDALAMRDLFGRRPAPEFEAWLGRQGLIDADDRIRPKSLPGRFRVLLS
ncbi:MAG TPA: PhzF family phenazine biosynthesis isomerase [Xanthobacteraceae bacterium]